MANFGLVLKPFLLQVYFLLRSLRETTVSAVLGFVHHQPVDEAEPEA